MKEITSEEYDVSFIMLKKAAEIQERLDELERINLKIVQSEIE